jgi:hypothetical protein
VDLADVMRYMREMGVPDLSRDERAALPRVLRAAVMADELNRRRVSRLTVVMTLSAVANVGATVWGALHR